MQGQTCIPGPAPSCSELAWASSGAKGRDSSRGNASRPSPSEGHEGEPTATVARSLALPGPKGEGDTVAGRRRPHPYYIPGDLPEQRDGLFPLPRLGVPGRQAGAGALRLFLSPGPPGYGDRPRDQLRLAHGAPAPSPQSSEKSLQVDPASSQRPTPAGSLTGTLPPTPNTMDRAHWVMGAGVGATEHSGYGNVWTLLGPGIGARLNLGH